MGTGSRARRRTAAVEITDGAPDGVSQYTHRAATAFGVHGGNRVGSARALTVRQMIGRQERKLRELYTEQNEAHGDRLRKLQRDIDAKKNFIARLWKELAANIREGRA